MLENIINKLLNHYNNIFSIEEKDILVDSIKKIFKDYSYTNEEEIITPLNFYFLTSNLKEKTKQRKKLGAYYTPTDVCNFMIKKMLEDDDQIIAKKIFEPTCGNSEFLISYFDYIYEKNMLDTDEKIIMLLEKMYGNDINHEALIISKLRLLFKVLEKLNDKKLIKKITDILNKNFFNLDALDEILNLDLKFDYIIGNPPYIESSKLDKKIEENFGNVYANILKNSLLKLKENGKICFIIPISYVSTLRMKKIRDFIMKNTKKQVLYNFSDRPDCLFNSVHQKLTILIAEKGNEKNKIHKIYTSSYNYWYKNERKEIFNNLINIEVEKNEDFIPKIKSKLEKNILKKILYKKGDKSLYDVLSSKQGDSLFLNMRATFWIKSFMNGAKSKEYKEYKIEKNREYIYCLLNSNLFFWYWIVISDCWHITNKELKNFKMLDIKENEKIIFLSKKLESKLEETKQFIGSKQIEYEYKHKKCKYIIDKIDDIIGEIYSLTLEEVEYLKKFNEKYRLNKGERNA